jgi:hypothetical protein
VVAARERPAGKPGIQADRVDRDCGHDMLKLELARPGVGLEQAERAHGLGDGE